MRGAAAAFRSGSDLQWLYMFKTCRSWLVGALGQARAAFLLELLEVLVPLYASQRSV